MRLRGYDESTEELSDDLKNITGDIADLTKTASNGGKGISLFTDESSQTYKSTYEIIKEIAKRQPLRAVFRDSSFANSPSKINVGEIFKLMAPDTRVKVI